MKSFIAKNKILFTDKNFLISFFGGTVLLGVSLIIQFFVSGYLNNLPDAPVTDLILSNIRTYDVSGIFVYGTMALLFMGIFTGFTRINCVPFMMKGIALFSLIRSVFVILTHISAFPTHIIIESPFFIYQYSTAFLQEMIFSFLDTLGYPFFSH